MCLAFETRFVVDQMSLKDDNELYHPAAAQRAEDDSVDSFVYGLHNPSVNRTKESADEKEQLVSCNKLLFPTKLRRLLDDAERDGNEHIVSWLSHGKAFKVHRPEEFTSRIMTKYFRQTQFKSFTRQLYHYGFGKVDSGSDRGAFYHPQFQRDNISLCLAMDRKNSRTHITASLPMLPPHGIQNDGGLSNINVNSRVEGENNPNLMVGILGAPFTTFGPPEEREAMRTSPSGASRIATSNKFASVPESSSSVSNGSYLNSLMEFQFHVGKKDEQHQGLNELSVLGGGNNKNDWFSSIEENFRVINQFHDIGPLDLEPRTLEQIIDDTREKKRRRLEESTSNFLFNNIPQL